MGAPSCEQTYILLCLRPSPTQATTTFMTEYLALQHLNTERTWQLRWLEVVDFNSPLLELCPGHVALQEVSESMPFWPPPRRTRGRVSASANARATSRFMAAWGAAAAQSREPEVEQPDEDEGVTNLPLPPGSDTNVPEGLMQRALEQACFADVPDDVEDVPDAGSVAAFPPLVPASPSAHADAPTVAAEETLAMAKAPQLPETQAEEPAARRRRTEGGRRMAAEVTVTLPGGGKIAYYSNKAAFEATCPNPAHGHCALTRTSKSRQSRQHGLVAGRPLGLMCCWLNHAEVASKSDHWHLPSWHDWCTKEARVEARRALSELPGGPALMGWERAKAEGEASEAETLHGYV